MVWQTLFSMNTDICPTLKFKHEPFQEINTISTQSVVFQYVYLFRFRMKKYLVNSSFREWNAMMFTKGLRVCIWHGCQTSCLVKFKTVWAARRPPRIPNPPSCEPRTCLGASSGGGVLVGLWWPSSAGPDGNHKAKIICAGSSWNVVMIPGPYWIQRRAVLFLYQSLFHYFVLASKLWKSSLICLYWIEVYE